MISGDLTSQCSQYTKTLHCSPVASHLTYSELSARNQHPTQGSVLCNLDPKTYITLHACMYNYVLGMYLHLCTEYVLRMYESRYYSAAQCSALLHCSVYQTHFTNQTTKTSHHSQPHQMPQVRSWMLPRLFPPDKESGIFFATSKAPEKAKRGDLRMYHTYIYSSLHKKCSVRSTPEYFVRSTYYVLGVTHRRTSLIAHRLEPIAYSLSSITCSLHTYVTSCSCQNGEEMGLHH